MKKRSIFQAVCGTVVMLAIVGFPNRALLQPQDQAQNQCSTESKKQHYRDFLTSYESESMDQAKALEAAKQYLACFGDPNDQEDVLAKLNLAVGRCSV